MLQLSPFFQKWRQNFRHTDNYSMILISEDITVYFANLKATLERVPRHTSMTRPTSPMSRGCQRSSVDGELEGLRKRSSTAKVRYPPCSAATLAGHSYHQWSCIKWDIPTTNCAVSSGTFLPPMVLYQVGHSYHQWCCIGQRRLH